FIALSFDTGLEVSLDLGDPIGNPFLPPKNLQLAQVDPSGQLTLNTGPNAGNRGYAVPDLQHLQYYNESFTVTPDAPQAGDPPGGEAVLVTAYGFSQHYGGVKSVFADLGAGGDTVFVGQGVKSPVKLIGGAGHGQLECQGGG